MCDISGSTNFRVAKTVVMGDWAIFFSVHKLIQAILCLETLRRSFVLSPLPLVGPCFLAVSFCSVGLWAFLIHRHIKLNGALFGALTVAEDHSLFSLLLKICGFVSCVVVS